ncbi:MAG: hypothetical protein PQJ44_08145 [Sphaerochaetaceae bacterium]|nr:hypothetical protein [Sphaerochaetaceae bacterium]
MTNNIELEEENRSDLNYYLRKYGRVTLIASVLLLAILTITGNTPDIGIGSVSFGSKTNSSVAIQGSKHVNPPLHSEYWTSNKFDF